MFGQLHIYKNVSSLQDWQQAGHGYHACFGARYTPTIKLLPFFFTTPKTLTVSEFKARKINTTSRTEKIVEESITITSAYLVKTSGTYRDTWVYSASDDIVGIDKGLWEFYIKFSDNTEYISDVMQVPDSFDIDSVIPDFNDDFSGDFLI